jgi:two-component sensor histidine kinase
MRRAPLLVQLLAGWIPVAIAYIALIMVAHGSSSMSAAVHAGILELAPAIALGFVVARFVERHPWPRPFRASFALLHVLAAAAYAGAWVVSGTLLSQLLLRLTGHAAFAPPALPFFIMGLFLYAMVAGVAYANQATARAAQAEAARSAAQLAALRAQLHPHFLFNALHAVVHLIPRAPAEAQRAAEELAALLRVVVEEDRDEVTLAEEWAFVSRYLALEALRLGDRLVVTHALSPEARAARVPAFAVQALVENAVQHGAAPRIEPTQVVVRAAVADGALTITVEDDGAGIAAAAPGAASRAGTGLARLRERLAVLHGASARLDVGPAAPRGVRAVLVVPAREDDDA